jgi:exo-beta-1,3-glucanase (GH17 family)
MFFIINHLKLKVMKGIYLTEESKKELENKIEYLSQCFDNDDFNNQCIGKIELLEEILSSATIINEKNLEVNKE